LANDKLFVAGPSIKSEIIPKQPADADPFAEALEARCGGSLLVVSANTSSLDFEYVSKEFHKISELFQKDIFLSYKLGELEPNKPFYEKLISLLNMNPEECLFVDDMYENVVSARKCSFNAIQYRTIEQFLYKLREHGIPEPQPGNFA